MNFGEALQALKEGKQIKRAIWGGYWELAKDADMTWEPRNDGYKRACSFNNGIIIAVLKDGGGVTTAQPYQQDLLAEDWQIVE